jgi:divalent metal cation (Fe/Co/Zn/Cd) transporter
VYENLSAGFFVFIKNKRTPIRYPVKPGGEILLSRAFQLSLFTILYNFAEGLISMVLGYHDETIALFGFGADSFIEVMSGTGIAVMIMRIRKNPESAAGRYETTALKVTGTSFYLLTAALVAGIVAVLVNKSKPETTVWGVVISLVSIGVMLWLVKAKRHCGIRLNSEPILADAGCTMVCVYMSVVLLLSSLVYELTGFIYADAIGAAGLAWFSFKEGKEAFEKAEAADNP